MDELLIYNDDVWRGGTIHFGERPAAQNWDTGGMEVVGVTTISRVLRRWLAGNSGWSLMRRVTLLEPVAGKSEAAATASAPGMFWRREITSRTKRACDEGSLYCAGSSVTPAVSRWSGWNPRC